MAEIDTSSYPKALPVQQPGMLDTAAKLGAMQSQALTIDKQKLDLVNQRYTTMLRGLASLPDDATAKEFIDLGQQYVKQGLITPEMFAKYATGIPTNPAEIPRWRQKTFQQLSEVPQMINNHYGVPGTIDTGQTVTPTRTSPYRPGPIPGGPPIQKQVPPTTEVLGPGGVPQILGPQPSQLPVGAVQQPGGLPGQYVPPTPGSTAPIVPKPVTSLPVTAPPSTAPLTPPMKPPLGSPSDRIAEGFDAAQQPRGPITGLAPGEREARTITGAASGTQLAQAREAANNYQREVFPLEQAIPLLDKLGTKGTGPGTETINHLKSFILSNVPGVTEDSFKGLSDVAAYDKAKKYLTDFVNQTGSSGTNDKLAAAFAGNPSVGISNAAAADVAKAALALRKMKQAQILEFHKLNLPDDQFAKWATTWSNTQDARAYGFDLMSKEKQDKLLKSMTPQQKAVFARSLRIAHEAGLTNPITPAQ